MSQTIEEIIAQKEQELGLNEEQLSALKDFASKSEKFIGIYQPIIDESAEAKDATKKAKNLKIAMKTTTGRQRG